jgi:hypothetical protein
MTVHAALPAGMRMIGTRGSEEMMLQPTYLQQR